MYVQAQEVSTPSPGIRKPSVVEQFMPFVFILAIVYFLFIRPHQKRMQKHNDFIKNLKQGDEVLTSGGILGKIQGLTEQYITLEISEKVKIRVLRQNILSLSKSGQHVDRKQ